MARLVEKRKNAYMHTLEQLLPLLLLHQLPVGIFPIANTFLVAVSDCWLLLCTKMFLTLLLEPL